MFLIRCVFNWILKMLRVFRKLFDIKGKRDGGIEWKEVVVLIDCNWSIFCKLYKRL